MIRKGEHDNPILPWDTWRIHQTKQQAHVQLPCVCPLSHQDIKIDKNHKS